MTSKDELAALLNDLLDRVGRLETGSQLSSSTVGDDADAAAVGDVVVDSAVTNLAIPGIQEDTADSNQGVIDLQNMLSAVSDDLDARFDGAAVDLDLAREEIAESQEEIRDAFGQSIEGLSERIDQIVVGEGGILLLFSEDAPTGDDKAPPGSTWWMINADKAIVGQWQQTGTDDVPVWTPRQIESDIIANLDVGKLTAGQAAIAQLVAMKIAASTANIQTVNVGNLFVTDGATMNQATINYLFANVVQAKKITADMIDVNSLSGITLTGATVQTAVPGGPSRAMSLSGTALYFWEANNDQPVGYMASSPTSGGGSFATFQNVSGGAVNLGAFDYGTGIGVRTVALVGNTLVNGTLYAGNTVVNTLLAQNQATLLNGLVSKKGATGTTTFSVDLTGTVVAAGTVTAADFRLPNGSSIVRKAEAAGTATHTANIASGTFGTSLNITFPAGLFTDPPIVTSNASNSRVMSAPSSVTKDGASIGLGNWSPGIANGPIVVTWRAIASS